MTARSRAKATLFPILLALLSLAAAPQHPPAPITARAAATHVGQTVSIAGQVSNVHVSAKGTVFINFDRPFPDQDFTAVIFASSAARFGDVKRLQGKRVVVNGPVSVWKGKPEMILRDPRQLRAVH